MLRYLGPEVLRQALPMADAIEAVAAVFRAAAAGTAAAPERSLLQQPLKPGREMLLLNMSARWTGHALVTKVTSYIDDNPSLGRPAVQGVAVLVDADTGEPLLLADAGALTVRRTAAMVGLATRILAREDAEVLGIIGTGALAPAMVRAIETVRPIRRIVAFNRTPAKAAALAQAVRRPVEVAPDADAVAKIADVLVVATSSPEPVLSGSAIGPGTHINAVGNFSPVGRELDAKTVGKASIWVDSYEGALAEAGDLLLAAEEGVIEPGRAGVCGDLAELVTGSCPVRAGASEVTLFKSVGTALADLGALWQAHEQALAQDLGHRLD